MMRRSEGLLMAALMLLAGSLVLAWGPARAFRTRAREDVIQRAIAAREIHVSAAELATLIKSRLAPLVLLDLREEAEFNAFHLLDARRFEPTGPELWALRALPERAIKVLIDEDEQAANATYRRAATHGVKQLYVLEGGIRAWLALVTPPVQAAGALGDRHPASDPQLEQLRLPKFKAKVKLDSAHNKRSGGCGG